MNFLKTFKQLLESIKDFVSEINWKVTYNDGKNHDLDNKLSDRTNMTEHDFKLFLKDVIDNCENNKLKGDWTFISIKFGIKLITNVKYKNIYIVTILGKNESLKNENNIKIIS